MTTMQYSVDHPPPHCGFHFREGWLYCDDVRISDLGQQLQASGVFPATPVFVYSRRQLEDNVQQYRSALHVLPVAARLNFSLKANFNLQVSNIRVEARSLKSIPYDLLRILNARVNSCVVRQY